MRMFVTNLESVTILPRTTIKIRANRLAGTDPDCYLVEELLAITGNSSSNAPSQQFDLLARFSIDLQLETGTNAVFMTGFNLLRLTSPLIAIGITQEGFLSGYFVAE